MRGRGGSARGALLPGATPAARSRPPRSALREQQRRELAECAAVHATFEKDYLAERLPVVYPTPAVEFRLLAGVEAKAVFAVDQPQHEPDLLLADAHRLAVAP